MTINKNKGIYKIVTTIRIINMKKTNRFKAAIKLVSKHLLLPFFIEHVFIRWEKWFHNLLPIYRIDTLSSGRKNFLKIWRSAIRHSHICAWTHLLFPVKNPFFVKSEKTLIVSSMTRACKNLIWAYRLSDVKVQMCLDHRASKWLLPLNVPPSSTGSFFLQHGQQAGEKRSSTVWIFFQLMQMQSKSCAYDKRAQYPWAFCTHESAKGTKGRRGWAEGKDSCPLVWRYFTQPCSHWG